MRRASWARQGLHPRRNQSANSPSNLTNLLRTLAPLRTATADMITLSIVIPAFEEERKIAQDIRAAAAFLTSQKMTGEIIVSDDGSKDRTASIAEGVELPREVLRSVIRAPLHLGKGAAVRSGILASRGEFVLFADCGLTVPYENALKGLRLLADGQADLAHGSRSLPGSMIRKDRDWDRTIISRLFHALVIHWMHIPVQLTDTQCGFKLYCGERARELYSTCTTDGFMFDIEIILLALRRELKIVEFPVEWTCDRDSRLGVLRSARTILRDLLRLRRMLVRVPPEDQNGSPPPARQ